MNIMPVINVNASQDTLSLATHLSNILYDDQIKSIAIPSEQLLQMVTLVDGPYRPANGVTFLEESPDDPDCDEAVCTGYENLGGSVDGGHLEMSEGVG
jgi:hypothetical protein